MIIKNLTERVLNIVDREGNVIKTILPEPISPRCAINEEALDQVNGIPIVRYNYFEVTGLPKSAKGVVLVVKFSILKALNGTRPDVVAPDSSPNSAKRKRNCPVEGVRQFVVL